MMSAWLEKPSSRAAAPALRAVETGSLDPGSDAGSAAISDLGGVEGAPALLAGAPLGLGVFTEGARQR